MMNARLNRVLLVLAGLALAGCEQSTISKAKDDVRRALKDPDSAKFDMVRIGPTGAVCGWVNSKNIYGGYSGNTAFMAGGPIALPRFADGSDLQGLTTELAGGSEHEEFWAEWTCNCETFQQRASEATRSGKAMKRCPGDPPPKSVPKAG